MKTEEKIIEKLKLILAKPIKKECQVVCLLVNIRKLLERKGTKKKYPVLNFYCNWALHSIIDRKIDPKIRDLLDRIVKNINDTAVYEEEMCNFREFQRELGEFLLDFSIRYDLDSNWIIFRKLLIDIISSCPLVVKEGEIKEFEFAPSKDYKTADCIIKFRNKKPDTVKISVSFLNY